MPSKNDLSLTDATSAFKRTEPINPPTPKTFEQVRQENAKAIKDGGMTVRHDWDTGQSFVVEWVG